MLTHYNRIVISCLKDFFQSIDTNNVAEVLQALKELNFVLANRVLELAADLQHGIRTMSNFCRRSTLTLSRHTSTMQQPTTLSTASEEDHSLEVINTIGTTVSHLPLPRYNQQSQRSDAHFHPHPNRKYSNTHFHNDSKHNSAHPIRNVHNTSNSQVKTIAPQSPNNSDLIGSLQSQILGLQAQALQQSTLNLIKIFNGTNKSKFTLWVQSVENATRLCNLDTLSIALSKLQGPPLKSASYPRIQGNQFR